jgi:hypothetical protein
MKANPMIDFFSNLRLPVKMESSNIVARLKNQFVEFNVELSRLMDNQPQDSIFDKQIYTDLKKKSETLKKFSSFLIDSLSYYQDGQVFKAYNIFENAMNEMQDHFAYLDIRNFRFFRIRPETKKATYKRKELFHIPFEKNYLIRTSRYSIPGFPCLYLGASAYSNNSLSLCWFECDLPDKFYWSELKLCKHEQPYLVLDFVHSPFSSASQAVQYRKDAHNKKLRIVRDFARKMRPLRGS